jgi:uncharacterized protein (TIGR03437 family)
LLLVSIDASGQTRHNVAARATGNLDAIARLPRSRVVEATGPPREIEEPERALRRRNAAGRRSPAPRVSPMLPTAPATVSPTFNGFLALADNFRAVPPDTGGAVGPQHLVTMLNTQVVIQSRTGAVRDNYPITLNAFWSPLGAGFDTFDPRILYDPVADRWIASAAANPQSSTSAFLVAVSRTGDPGGDWNYFQVAVGTSNQWGDFPVLGFNGSWVVVSLNLFRITNGNYIQTNLYVFSKADLYAQNGTGAFSSFRDLQGELTPVRDSDNRSQNTLYLVQAIAADFLNPPDHGAIRISKIEGPVGSETFRGGSVGTILVSDPWADSPSEEGDFGPQLGTLTKIDTGDGRLINCLLRTGTIWCSHTVFLPSGNPTRAAAQWFQVNAVATPPAIVQRGRIQDATNNYFYAYPSIAVNKNSDVVVGYTRFSAGDYPSAAFSFRTASDPPNTMQPEVLVKAGEASYVNPGTKSGANRWGDYSATIVDPVNDLNFWTIQEYASTPPRGRSGAFGAWWTQIMAPSGNLDCTYSLSANSASFDLAGGEGAVTVNVPAGCPWLATSTVPWTTVQSGVAGIGTGTVTYSVGKAADNRTGTIAIAGLTFTLLQGPPTFSASGVANAASFLPGAIAPGELITIFGTNLGPPVLQTVAVTAGQFDIIAGGTRVLFDGVAAPMLYAGGGQISAIAPFGLQGRSSTQVQVEFQGTKSAAATVQVKAAAPAIFTANASGKGQGAVLNQDFSVNSASLPAARGSVVMIYATGAGVLSAPSIDGHVPALPPASINQAVSVRIGGVTVLPVYAGAAPGIVNGVVQINALVPDNIVPGAAVPIDLTIGGVTTPTGVTIAVK